MAKKKRTVQKKVSRSGKDRHDTEILRAKRAVSAALSDESSVALLPAADASRKPAKSLSSAGIPGVMKGLVHAAAGLLGHGSPPVAVEQPTPPPGHSSLSTYSDPIAELARRHISRSTTSLAHPERLTDQFCRQVLANLAQVRLDTVLQSPSKPTGI